MTKKIFPYIALVLTFTVVTIVQMIISGDELSASKMKAEKKKYAAFETNFRKLKLKTTKGNDVDLNKVEQPIVILNFWASWCRPCLSEFQGINKLIDKFGKDKVFVLGVNNDTEKALDQIRKIENKYNLKFDSISDMTSDITSKFFISNIPASIVYHNGSVVHFSNQEFDFYSKEFQDKISRLIQ